MNSQSNNQPITKKDLDKVVEEHFKVIVEAVDYEFKKVHEKLAEVAKIKEVIKDKLGIKIRAF